MCFDTRKIQRIKGYSTSEINVEGLTLRQSTQLAPQDHCGAAAPPTPAESPVFLSEVLRDLLENPPALPSGSPPHPR